MDQDKLPESVAIFVNSDPISTNVIAEEPVSRVKFRRERLPLPFLETMVLPVFLALLSKSPQQLR